MRGHIYNLVGICSADLFTIATHAIATYMGHELGGNIHHSIEMFTLATLTCPTRPLPPPPSTDGTVIPIDPTNGTIQQIGHT